MISMTDLISTFLNKFNENLTEQFVESMKHAVEVMDKIDRCYEADTIHLISFFFQIQSVNDVKYVTITKMMQFIVHIVNIIQQRGTVKITDLKNILNVSINSCFAFGN